MGTEVLSTHLFVFYFAILAGITPPVCVPAYCAASIAQSKPLQTGYEAFKLAIIGFLIPYIFIYNEVLLMRGTIGEIVTVVAGVVLAMICILASFSGYLFSKISWVARIGIGALAVAFITLCAMPDILNTFSARTIIFMLLFSFLLRPFLKTYQENVRPVLGAQKE